MGRNLSGLVVGLVLGLGLTIAEMTNPAKVLAFLDVSGDWNPSLAFVMGSALIVTAIGYRVAWRYPRPLFDSQFHVPQNRVIDARLAIGALMFGAGWGLVGLCPGPAIAALTIGGTPAAIFLGSMIVGMAIHHFLTRSRNNQTTSRA